MRDRENIDALVALQPDYMGLIFYRGSSRNVEDVVASDSAIEKVGVFVNATKEVIKKTSEIYGFKTVQLHGTETPEFCNEMKAEGLKIIKAFSISNDFDFFRLEDYKSSCDYFLFDTKGKLSGGNGQVFDWTVLDKYDNEIPFFLSGGIGLEHKDALKKMASEKNWNLHAIDVNSKFEIEPAFKDIGKVEEMIDFVKKEL